MGAGWVEVAVVVAGESGEDCGNGSCQGGASTSTVRVEVEVTRCVNGGDHANLLARPQSCHHESAVDEQIDPGDIGCVIRD